MRSSEPELITIDTLAVDGCGYGNDGHAAVYGALPGESVQAQPIARKRKRQYFRVTEVLNTSADRVEPRCSAALYCGGCSFQHLAHAEQLVLKQAHLESCLQPLSAQAWLPPLSAEPYGYRTKARLGVKFVEKKNRVLVGFREKQKPYIADIENCPVLIPVLSELIQPLENLVSSLTVMRAVPQVEVAAGDTETALIFRHLEPLADADIGLLRQFAQVHQLKIYLQSGGPESVTPLSPASGSEPDAFLHFSLPDTDLTFAFAPQDFTQVNLAVNRLMVNRAIELLALDASDQVLDAFCGIGNFSLAVARSGAQVFGAEFSAASIDRARHNAAHNGITNADFGVFDLHDESVEIPGFTGFNKVLLDPPRSGAMSLVKKLETRNVERVVYVSCNPETLARDAEILVEQGFTLRSAGIIDMFPHTTHVESIALFIRQEDAEKRS